MRENLDRPPGGHGGRWGARVLVLALVVGACGLGIEAVAEAHGAAGASLTRAVASTYESLSWPKALSPEPDETEKLVWRGLDVDGDGQDDFANPTGKGLRGCDDYGCGRFGAERDAGGRHHEGVDFDAAAGQTVDAPISGFVSKIGYAYPDDQRYKFIEIVNPALHYLARVFYVDPRVREGQPVHIGQAIGRDRSLEPRYPGITNHVHLEIGRIGGPRLDASRFVAERMEPEDQGASRQAQADGAASRG